MDGISEEKIQWFKEQNFEVQLYPEKTVKKFRDPQDLLDFMEGECVFWANYQTINSSFKNSLENFRNAVATPEANTDQWRNHFNNGMALVKSGEGSLRNGASGWILFSTSLISKKLISILEDYGTQGADWFVYYCFQQGATIKTKANLVGALEGYMFSEQSAHLRKTVTKSGRAFDELHSSFDTFFDDCVENATERRNEFESITAEIAAWKSDEESAVKAQRDEFQTSHEGRGLQHREEFVQSMKDWKQKVSDLEELYESKLQLEEPVKYWDQLRESHSRWGIGFSVCTGVVGILLICIFYNILYSWPPQWLEGNKWDLNTVKGTILLLTMTSVGLYLISLGAKFAVSSFHLARDAQERRQLTYIYLSLIQKGAIKPEEQKIVLQALFSRADTGLLKGDHGPTMPGAELLGKIKG